MKVKMFYLFIVAVIFVCVGWSFYQNAKYMKYSDLALANIEALAQGEAGTTTGTCYTRVDEASSGKYQYKCNSSTNATTIYPCPTQYTEGWAENIFRDRCTK